MSRVINKFDTEHFHVEVHAVDVDEIRARSRDLVEALSEAIKAKTPGWEAFKADWRTALDMIYLGVLFLRGPTGMPSNATHAALMEILAHIDEGSRIKAADKLREEANKLTTQ